MLIPIRRPWTSQPQVPVTPGAPWRLIEASVGNSSVNIVNNDPLSVVSTLPASNLYRAHTTLSVSGTDGDALYINAAPNSTDYCLLVVTSLASTASTKALACLDNSASAHRRFQFRNNAGALNFIAFNTSDAAFTASIASAVVANKMMAFAGGVSNGKAFCCAGTAYAETTITGTPRTFSTSDLGADARWFERWAGAVDSHAQQESALRAIIAGPLSKIEILNLVANPWQIFAP